ncbi:MAG TPA: NAD(P)H-binding protein [Conexibacter sp.]|jgi:uncharacterized protein YbjT (DUF2867 family)
MSTVLVTGASGYIGGRLATRLAAEKRPDMGELRLMMRRPKAAHAPPGAKVVAGDAVSGEGLAQALDGVDVAYYLIHSMGRGGDRGFEQRDRAAATAFGRAAREARVRRLVYLGGLSSENSSAHLRSREEVAELLGAAGPRLTHVRAAMVIGAGSASFQMLRALVARLPAMVCPRWIDTRTQPIAIDDVVGALAALRDRDDVAGDVQLGGPEPLSYRAMMEQAAAAMGRRPPAIVRVPVLTPRLSSYWVTLVTPVEAGLVRPLVDGLREEMVVTAPPPPGVNDDPQDFGTAVRAALAGR